ncbi:MAG: peptide synthetase [Chloroflexota bacterium]|nr:peptide synthetase [Chloroflexota bacterium]
MPAQPPVPASREAVAPASTWQYILCGTLQFLLFLGYCFLIALVIDRGYVWIAASTGWIDMYVRFLVFGGAIFLVLCTVPILAKWMLIGRWKPQEIPIWSLAYVRFWTVKTLVQFNPLVLFVGSPIYGLYLRALGAQVGRGVAIFSRQAPVCTDLLSIGDGTVIRKDSLFLCYRAHAGVIQTGAVTLGKDVFVGERTVIDIETSMGDGAQLGHSSSLHASQAVPDGQRWHGSPAQPTNVDYRRVDPAHCSTLRRVFYSGLLLLRGLVLYMLAIGVVVTLITEVLLPSRIPLLAELTWPLDFTSWSFYGVMLVISFVLFFGAVLAGLALVVTIPRVLNLFLKPDKVYPLYGFHYWIQRTIAGMTNLKFFMILFGDSSYIVYYLRAIGYDLSQVEQTGSNFGNAQRHETPYLVSVGTGTMVSDGLSIINADFSSTSFRISPVSIGARCYLGNSVAYPSGGRIGDNCLLATKAMVPLDGDIREGVGLLGSPCFEIPRSVQSDSQFDHLKRGEELRRRLAAKNKYNAVTMGLFLLEWWLQFFGIILLIMATVDLYVRFGVLAIVVGMLLILVFTVSYSVLVDGAVRGFRPLSPQFCSIYEPYFWWHERFWKLGKSSLFNGTPFKNVISRLMGVRLGSRVFDDGCAMAEKTLVTIGNDCTLNAGSTIQCHSMEGGVFKSDHTSLGAGCTLGVGAFVHYGVTMGEGAVLDADAFLMKGEQIAPHARWWGNPARPS